MKKITIIIPCYNEELGIEQVIKEIPTERLRSLGYMAKIIVIDNNSTDRTAQIAKKNGATVLFERKKGKGNAVKKGFLAIDESTDIVVMVDGDGTYKAYEIPRLIEPLDSEFCDVIVGSRLGGKTKDGALRFTNRLANWVYTFLVRQFYGANVTDVLSGFFAWRREALDNLKLHLHSDGFAIEMEMITKMVKLGYEIYSVPITYDRRNGHSKLSALSDGARILKMFFQNIYWTPQNSKKGKLAVKVS